MIALAAMAVSILTADPAFGRVTERAKACISANAGDVERAEPSLAEAATFILDDLCAVPVSIRERYQMSAGWIASMSRTQPSDYDEEGGLVMDPKVRDRMKAIAAKQRDAFAHTTIDEETGDVVAPKGASSATGFIISGAPGRQTASPDLRAFAARALLDARKARQTR